LSRLSIKVFKNLFRVQAGRKSPEIVEESLIKNVRGDSLEINHFVYLKCVLLIKIIIAIFATFFLNLII